jgi:cyanate permease
MRTVWVTVLSVWALFAVVAVLAWTRQQTVPAASVSPQVVVVKGKNGTSNLVVQNTAPQATTRTSPVGAG